MYVDIDNRGLLTINDIRPEDAKCLSNIIRQADKQLLTRSLELLGKQLHSQLEKVVLPESKKP